jgi:hypothetical protein
MNMGIILVVLLFFVIVLGFTIDWLLDIFGI